MAIWTTGFDWPFTNKIATFSLHDEMAWHMETMNRKGVVTAVSPALAANEWAPSSSVSFSRKVALCPHTQAISEPTCKFSYQALQQKDKTLHAQLKQSQLIEYLKRWHAGSWLEESLQVGSLSCNQAPDHISFLQCKSHCHFSRNKMTKSTCTYLHDTPNLKRSYFGEIKHALIVTHEGRIPGTVHTKLKLWQIVAYSVKQPNGPASISNSLFQKIYLLTHLQSFPLLLIKLFA